MICPKCGKENSNNNKYCERCGKQLIKNKRVQETKKNSYLRAVAGILSVALVIGGVGLMLQSMNRNNRSNSLVKPDITEQEKSRQENQSEVEDEKKSDTSVEIESEIAEQENERETSNTGAETVINDYPEGALSYNGHHYYLFNDVKTYWHDAQEKCKERGGYLAVINDKAENEALFEYMKEMGYETAYFGMTDYQEEGNWTYLYGDNASFSDWGKNSKGVIEPNNADDGENYAEFDVHMKDGHWNDAQFGRQTYTPEGEKYNDLCVYICEWSS